MKINQQTIRQKFTTYKNNPLSLILLFMVIMATLFTLGVLVLLIGYILIQGIPFLKPELFAFTYNTENVSMLPAIINTITMTIFALLLAIPFGISSAIYLVEYASKGNRLVGIVRLTTETLSGIPSIVYGLFGFLFFVIYLGWGYSLLAGAFTLAVMILPLIIRTTEEALMAVPDTYREGSFGLGAGKLRTVFRIILPTSMPGILGGVILGIGRITGETAALIYTAGTVTGIPENVMGSGRTLAVHMYSLSSEGLYTNQAYATGVVLLLIVIVINALSTIFARKLSNRYK